MQAQECCRKGESYRRLSLFGWHRSILGSFDTLKPKKVIRFLNLDAKTVGSTTDLCTDNRANMSAVHIIFICHSFHGYDEFKKLTCSQRMGLYSSVGGALQR